jgi:CubicO group peptidase (beta-lactamase class C family)
MLATLLLCFVPQAPDAAWRQYATPEQAGFSSERIAEAWAFADQKRSGAVFAVHRGHVLLAWGEVERRYECHSVRKSLMNALIGIAVDEKKLALDDTLAELGIDDLQPLSETEKRATLADLLGSRSGVYHPAAKEPADMRAERPARGSHAPGEFFFYNNWDFNVLGAIFEHATKTSVATAFEQRIARPLGMEDFRPRDVFPELAPGSSRFAAHAFRLSARDLARFGELYRTRGRCGERVLLQPQWIERSTSPQPESNYGFLWWPERAGSLGAKYPALDQHDSFAARGTGGQFLLVVPGADFVFVHRGDTDNERAVRGADCWRLAEMVLAARTGSALEKPELVAVQAKRFTDAGPARPDHTPVAVDAAAFAALAGEYEYPGMGVRVFVHEQRLFARRSDGEEAELLPLSPTRYFMFTTAYEIEFDLDASGRATGARLKTPKGTIAGKRAPQ